MAYRSLSAIIVIMSVATTLADATTSAPPSPPAVDRRFLTTHCFKCHAAGVEDATVRLDDLPATLTTVESAERWQKVLNVLNSGEMPPEEEPRPEAAAKTEFLATLSHALATARKTIGDQGRIATLRRLNRREYQHTLRDLLAVDVDVRTLPDDKITGSFDTLGSSLFMSSDQFEQYLAVGRNAVTDAVARWQQLATPPTRKSTRTEVEIGARRQMSELLNGYFLDGYRRGTAWKAAGGEPAKAKEFGFPDEQEAKFRIEQYKGHGPYLGAYLAMSKSDAGAWLTYYTNNYYYQQTITIPSDWQTGDYVLRARVGFNNNVPPARRFLDFGVPTRVGETDEFQVLDTFHVTGSIHDPITLEIPVTVTAKGPRQFSLREKRHASRDSDYFHNALARARNGVGTDLALWVDWVERAGPLPDATTASRLLATFGTAFPHDGDTATAHTIIDHFATRAFRGVKPQANYIDGLVGVYETQHANGKSFADALVEPLAVVLASPAFLYLTEPVAIAPRADAATAETDRSLSNLELASRLSYFLWAAPPDDELLAAATAGSLRAPEGLAAQTARLIADRRSFDFAQGFTHQWLDVDRLDFFRFDHQLYPEFDESTREAAKGEIYHTFHTLLGENLDVRKLLKNDFVVINGLLATYYGLDDAGKPVQGMSYRKVALPAASPRGGLLGMAAVLGMGSNGERTSPVERGAWVLRKLLNDPPPPAPANVPQLSRLDGKHINTRERLRMHQEQPQCAQCHRVIDPIGFGLENFDAAGRWQTEEHAYGFGWIVKDVLAGKVIAASFPIDPAGAFHQGPSFKDFFELRDRIADRGDDFLRGLIENLYAYALGRPVSFADADTIDALVAQAKAGGGRLASIIQAIVATPEFQTK
jgi:hypothetical protein